LGGAAWAAPKLAKNSVGTKQLKKNAVNSSKVANGSLTGMDIRLSSLGAVPNATQAANLGGVPPSGYQHTLQWAAVDGGGSITAQSGGIQVVGTPGGGTTSIEFPSPNRLVTVTSFATNADISGRGTPYASICQPGSTNLNCNAAGGTNDAREAIVFTTNMANNSFESHPFVVVGYP
jgi:hypothetical protein